MRAVVAVAACLLMIPLAGAFPGAGLGAPIRDAGVRAPLATIHDELFGHRVLIIEGDGTVLDSFDEFGDICGEYNYQGPVKWSVRHAQGSGSARMILENDCLRETQELEHCTRGSGLLRCAGEVWHGRGLTYPGDPEPLRELEESTVGYLDEEGYRFDLQIDLTTGAMSLEYEYWVIEDTSEGPGYGAWHGYTVEADGGTVTRCDGGGLAAHLRDDLRCYIDVAALAGL